MNPRIVCPGSVACNKPKMRDKNGRTWDSCSVILADETQTKIDGYLDTSWGHYFYFQIDGQWRKAKIDTFFQTGTLLADFNRKNP